MTKTATISFEKDVLRLKDIPFKKAFGFYITKTDSGTAVDFPANPFEVRLFKRVDLKGLPEKTYTEGSGLTKAGNILTFHLNDDDNDLELTTYYGELVELTGTETPRYWKLEWEVKP